MIYLDNKHQKKYKQDIYPKSTAEDIAILSHHLIAKHPKFLNITQLSQDTQKVILLIILIYQLNMSHFT